MSQSAYHLIHHRVRAGGASAATRRAVHCLVMRLTSKPCFAVQFDLSQTLKCCTSPCATHNALSGCRAPLHCLHHRLVTRQDGEMSSFKKMLKATYDQTEGQQLASKRTVPGFTSETSTSKDNASSSRAWLNSVAFTIACFDTSNALTAFFGNCNHTYTLKHNKEHMDIENYSRRMLLCQKCTEIVPAIRLINRLQFPGLVTACRSCCRRHWLQLPKKCSALTATTDINHPY
ncbi:hypothetical protein T02_13106 [Trichinella nativa]|uniref:Uncharacterized protein n=1 Tax=Trichinella nativa TaxID=6335 RepID=A0A0V1LHV9_9BILA|nr:hypothetical protein T02_13106 [Trichinella nativa]